MNAPGWRLHPLKGKLADHWAVWVDSQWRLTFAFEDGDAALVDYQDYHEGDTMTMHNPPHPGEVLREWLDGITVTDAAEHLGVTRVALSRVLNGAAGISPDMDLRLAKALNTTPGSWHAMQSSYNMWQAQRRFRAKVRPIITPPMLSAEHVQHRASADPQTPGTFPGCRGSL